CAAIPELVVEIEIPEVSDEHRTWQVRRIAVPVEKVERRRCFPLEIIADDIAPDEIVGAKARERRRELGAVDALPSHQGGLADREEVPRYVDADVARVRE